MAFNQMPLPITVGLERERAVLDEAGVATERSASPLGGGGPEGIVALGDVDVKLRGEECEGVREWKWGWMGYVGWSLVKCVGVRESGEAFEVVIAREARQNKRVASERVAPEHALCERASRARTR